MTGTQRMSEKQANARIASINRRRKAREHVRSLPPDPNSPVFRPRTPPGGSPGSPLRSEAQQYKDARDALKYYEEQRAASINEAKAKAPTEGALKSLFERLGVERPVEKAKGGLIKSRKKSSRKKSIDGLARKGKTKGKHR